MEERKGFFTKEQEQKLERVIKLNNWFLETVDGPIISTVDNIFLTKVIAKLSPELKEMLFGIIDEVMEALPETVE